MNTLSLQLGILLLHVHRVRTRAASLLPTILVLVPLLAVGLREFLLYLAQRDLGWVDRNAPAVDATLWLSFAFWQWIGAVVLWLALGHLLATSSGRRNASSPSASDQCLERSIHRRDPHV